MDGAEAGRGRQSQVNKETSLYIEILNTLVRVIPLRRTFYFGVL